jgi:hypothetical protein
MNRVVRCEIASLLFGVLLFLDFGSAQAAGNVKPLKVLIACNGEDIPGERVCSALKEKIRASVGFELVQLIDNADFCVHMVSVDLGSENLSSAMAVIFTTTAPDRIGTVSGTVELFLTASVLRFGVAHIDETADSVFADIDKESEFLRFATVPPHKD